MSDALEVAREWLDNLHPQFIDDDQSVLARAVIAQDEELARLRAALADAAARIESWAQQEYSGTSYFAREMAAVERWRKLVTP
jgi:hypothetical protein